MGAVGNWNESLLRVGKMTMFRFRFHHACIRLAPLRSDGLEFGVISGLEDSDEDVVLKDRALITEQ